jgi:hypothetical protein
MSIPVVITTSAPKPATGVGLRNNIFLKTFLNWDNKTFGTALRTTILALISVVLLVSKWTFAYGTNKGFFHNYLDLRSSVT